MCRLLAVATFVSCVLAGAQALAQNLYVTNSGSNTVSVIDTATNAVIATIPVGGSPGGAAVTPDGSKVYVGFTSNNQKTSGAVSVIATATNTPTTTIRVPGFTPSSVAVTPDGSNVYVTNDTNTVSVIDTARNAPIGTIPVGGNPVSVAVTPDGSKVYVVNNADSTVSMIAREKFGQTVRATIPVRNYATGAAVTPDGSKLYVASTDGTVSMIATATDTVITTIPSGNVPIGVFIQPAGKAIPLIGQAVPYSSLLLTTGGKQPAFTFNAFFTLGASSSGINPSSQPVTLHVGSYTATIPAGSFRQLTSGQIAQALMLLSATIPGGFFSQLGSEPSVTGWAFRGTFGNVSLAVDIMSLGNNSYQFGAWATPVDLTAVANPVPVYYRIGNNLGLTAVTATRLP